MEATDPYSTAKSNLRDTVKWFATMLAGLAALVLAGSPFSGFGALPPGSGRFYVALAGLATASVLLLTAWHQLIRLLRPDAVFESQLRSTYKPSGGALDQREINELREHLKTHKSDLLPDDVASFDALMERVNECWAEASQPSAAPALLEQWKAYASNVNMVINYAAFARLDARVKNALPRIMMVGVAAMLALVAFAWASNPGKAESSERVTVLQPLAVPASAQLPTFPAIHFAVNKDHVDSDGLAAITKVREFLRARGDAGVLLLAHTDTLGRTAVNRSLATRRGAAVRRLLVEAGGIAASRVFVAELPTTDLPSVTQPQVDSAENRVVEFLAVQLPMRR